MLIKHLGRVDYEPTYQAMVAFTDGRTEDTPDELWIVEPGIVTPAPGVPAPWKGWRLWQYTTAADGPENGVSASTVAVSRFNGTGTQFAGWVNLARMQGGSVGR